MWCAIWRNLRGTCLQVWLRQCFLVGFPFKAAVSMSFQRAKGCKWAVTNTGKFIGFSPQWHNEKKQNKTISNASFMAWAVREWLVEFRQMNRTQNGWFLARSLKHFSHLFFHHAGSKVLDVSHPWQFRRDSWKSRSRERYKASSISFRSYIPTNSTFSDLANEIIPKFKWIARSISPYIDIQRVIVAHVSRDEHP